MNNPAHLTDLVRSVVEPMGYELVGVEWVSQGRDRNLLRVYIDHENGITLDDCSAVSHQLSGVLDVEDPVSGNYHLEISSPGLDRPLFEPEHYDRFIGHEITVKTRFVVNGRKNYKGLLLAREDQAITLKVEDQEVVLLLNQIDKARLVPVL